MWLEALNWSVAANVIKDARRVLVSRHQQPTRWIHAYRSDWRPLPRVGTCCRRHHVNTTARSQVPESHRLVLRARNEHRAAPVVERQNVTAMTAQRLVRRRCGAIGDVDLAVAGTTADQQTRLVRTVFEEAKVSNGSVVHRQLDLFGKIDSLALNI